MTGRHAALGAQHAAPKPHHGAGIRRQIARRLSWGIADQAVSSLGNFLLGVFVARLLGATSLGALGLAFVAYAVALNCSRALATDAVMIRFSAAGKDSWRTAVAAATGVALLVGVAGGAACVAAGLVWRYHSPGSDAAAAFVALGIVLPGLMLQDSWRSAFFAAGEGAKTFLNDTVWTVLLIGILAVGAAVDVGGGITFAILVFGGTATVAGVFGAWQARIVPRPAHALSWLTSHRDLGTRFLIENVVLGAGGQIRALVVAATGGLAAAGAIRGAEMLIGPVAALLMGVGQVAVPEAARALIRGRRPLVKLCLALSGGLALMGVAWGLVVIVIFPFGPGEVVLGEVWPDARVLTVGVIVSYAAGCLHVGPSAGLRALGRADLTMQCQLTVTGLFVGLAAVGAILFDAQGAVWGTAIASVVGIWIWWSRLQKAEREHFAAAGVVVA
jgi:O-antigen/teichoic acid export membrane protein